MNRGLRQLILLPAIFVGAFLVVFLVRNGPSGLRDLLEKKRPAGEFRPEPYTLPDKTPLKLDDVQLLNRLNDEFAKLTEAVVPAVVSIDTSGMRSEQVRDGFGRRFIRPVPTKGQGSGVIVTREGHIVTNHHVIHNQQQIKITLYDGRSFSASLIGSDPLLDIAILKVSAHETFTPLPLGNSDEVRHGQIVFAIGNPFGLGETVTQGIISARERSLSDTQRDLLQTDAAINPGNSGGPLVNIRGEIVGINSAIYRPDQRVNSGFQGVGFSIPSNDVREALESILQRGRPIRGYLGVRMLDLDNVVRSRLGFSGEGSLVVEIGPGSPAEAAGLKAGDIIRSFANKPISSAENLFALVQRTQVGKRVSLQVWRNGAPVDLEVTIQEVPQQNLSQEDAAETQDALTRIGITADPAGAGRRGMVVTHVAPGSLAAGKILVGDRILAVNDQPVSDNPEEFQQQLAASLNEQAPTFLIERGGRLGLLKLPPPDK